MDKKRVAYISLGFGVLLLVIMAMLAWGGRRQTSEIILPESQTDTSGAGEDNPSSRGLHLGGQRTLCRDELIEGQSRF